MYWDSGLVNGIRPSLDKNRTDFFTLDLDGWQRPGSVIFDPTSFSAAEFQMGIRRQTKYYGCRRIERGELLCSLGNKRLSALTAYVAGELDFVAGYLTLIRNLELHS